MVVYCRAVDFELHDLVLDASDQTESDLLLAQMLQHEFDQEHDKMLHKEELKFNGDSKGTYHKLFSA